MISGSIFDPTARDLPPLVLKKRKIGRFNHYKPAAVLLREQAELAPKIDQDTIDRAGQLFARLNSLLPKR